MSYSRSGYGSRFSQPAKAPTPPPPNNSRLSVRTDLNTISSFQQIRDWIYEVVQEKDLKIKDREIENRALGAWNHWQVAWKTQSSDVVEFEWDANRNTIINR